MAPIHQLKRVALFAFAAIVAAAALLLATNGTSLGVVEEREPRTFGPRELPREWRWTRPPITFDHMFRDERERP